MNLAEQDRNEIKTICRKEDNKVELETKEENESNSDVRRGGKVKRSLICRFGIII